MMLGYLVVQHRYIISGYTYLSKNVPLRVTI